MISAVLTRDPTQRQQRQRARELEAWLSEVEEVDRIHHGLPRRSRIRIPARRLASMLGVLVLIVWWPVEHFERLGELVGLEDGGSHAFLSRQPGTDVPVTFNPCDVIEVVVNPGGAPPNYEQLVTTAINRTSAATGFDFDRVGTTSDRNFQNRFDGALSQIPPVLVGWASEQEVPQLAGDVLGFAGGVSVTDPGTGRATYVSGVVVLDGDWFRENADDQPARAQAVMDHEFGHLVGLDHVHDRGEIMNEKYVGQTSYGPGDLAGLARLGQVPC